MCEFLFAFCCGGCVAHGIILLTSPRNNNSYYLLWCRRGEVQERRTRPCRNMYNGSSGKGWSLVNIQMYNDCRKGSRRRASSPQAAVVQAWGALQVWLCSCMQRIYIHVSCLLRAGEMARGLRGRDEREVAWHDSLQGCDQFRTSIVRFMQDENSGKSHVRMRTGYWVIWKFKDIE